MENQYKISGITPWDFHMAKSLEIAVHHSNTCKQTLEVADIMVTEIMKKRVEYFSKNKDMEGKTSV